MLWLKSLATAQKIALAVIAGLLLIWALWFAYDLLTASDKVKGRLGANQADAALESGSDAANTAGNRADAENETDEKVKGISDNVEKAENAAAADAAGRDGLCQHWNICN